MPASLSGSAIKNLRLLRKVLAGQIGRQSSPAMYLGLPRSRTSASSPGTRECPSSDETCMGGGSRRGPCPHDRDYDPLATLHKLRHRLLHNAESGADADRSNVENKAFRCLPPAPTAGAKTHRRLAESLRIGPRRLNGSGGCDANHSIAIARRGICPSSGSSAGQLPPEAG